jgi:hypothetical protein
LEKPVAGPEGGKKGVAMRMIQRVISMPSFAFTSNSTLSLA